MQFLFGKPVLPAKPTASGPRKLLVLGAYPSALHVRWCAPGLKGPIKAVAVDNEPEPFWTGGDEVERIAEWRNDVSYREEWGRIEPCGRLNGPSGDWVSNQVLSPLGVTHDEAWITDCLDTYHESKGAAKRLDSEEVVEIVKRLEIPERKHRPHPSESKIVNDAIHHHTERLKTEIAEANPNIIVTLGNAALRVFNSLVDQGEDQIKKLDANESYGAELIVAFRGNEVSWIPLAHPAAPAAYQKAHGNWVVARGANA